MAAIRSITINFDGNITQVNYGGGQLIWTTSGESKSSFDWSGEFTCVLNEGYIIDTITTSSDITITNKTDTTFQITTTNMSVGTITITSKQSINIITIDLTTLSGWTSVADGTHNLSVVAKADGYKDSNASESVVVTKSSSSGETWVLNEKNLNLSTLETIVGSGLSINNVNYYPLIATNTYGDLTNGIFTIQADSIDSEFNLLSFNFGNPDSYRVNYDNGSWNATSNDTNYKTTDTTKLRTLIFETATSGDLLTWLQANGTKQSGGGSSGGAID